MHLGYKCTKICVSFNYPHSLIKSLPWSINLITFWLIIFLNGELAPDCDNCCAAELGEGLGLWLEWHTEPISKIHIYNIDTWINDISLEGNGTIHPPDGRGGVEITSWQQQHCSKHVKKASFPSAACFELELRKAFKHSFNWAAVQ